MVVWSRVVVTEMGKNWGRDRLGRYLGGKAIGT